MSILLAFLLLITACATPPGSIESLSKEEEKALEAEVPARKTSESETTTLIGSDLISAPVETIAPPAIESKRSSPLAATRRMTPQHSRKDSDSTASRIAAIDANEAPLRADMLLRSEVIEVERASGVPIAVLIDAGTPTGLLPGSLGRLVDAGQEIGRVEIVDVYAAGSRARVLGELGGPITTSTVVEVFDSTNSR